METAPGDSRRLKPATSPSIQLCHGFPRLTATSVDSLRSLCKPEVTGSIPVRSIRESAAKQHYRVAPTTTTHAGSASLERCWNGTAEVDERGGGGWAYFNSSRRAASWFATRSAAGRTALDRGSSSHG
jgi:hypothetical protein